MKGFLRQVYSGNEGTSVDQRKAGMSISRCLSVCSLCPSKAPLSGVCVHRRAPRHLAIQSDCVTERGERMDVWVEKESESLTAHKSCHSS